MTSQSNLGLFYLVPKNELALDVVNLNPSYASRADPAGGRVLSFNTNRPSKTKGQLATFGRHESNDIRLPSGRRNQTNARERSSGRYQMYRNNHCFFFLAESGELLLRDLTSHHTTIEVADASRSEAVTYALHGEDPRQRVIPRTSRDIYITLGVSTRFLLVWNSDLLDANQSPAPLQLASHARLLAASRLSVTRPDDEETEPSTRYELRSRFTPTGTTQSGPFKHIHRYTRLGAGTFGVVHKAVDMSTGDLWAVKEIQPGARSDRWKESFKREVEMISSLRHANIAHFESFQGFSIGGSFQLFFHLYKGSLPDLLAAEPHSCLRPLSTIPPIWTSQFVQHVLQALAYLHEAGVIHRDIKPENILFDYTQRGDLPSFYLADFGLSINADAVTSSNWAGTLAYIAPEVILRGITHPASDIWSFAITLGRVLGYWCAAEQSLTRQQWREKLTHLGCVQEYVERAQFRAPRPEQRRWYHRITFMAGRGILPPMFDHMLVNMEHRTSSARCIAAPTHDFTFRPGTAQVPVTAPSSSAAMLHLGARDVNDMSIDVPRDVF